MKLRHDSLWELIQHKITKSAPYHGGHYAAPTWGDWQAADALFSGNGLANVIISAPAEDALRKGFTLKNGELELPENAQLQSLLEDLETDKIFAQALSWDRLYGGAAILMLANDGGSLEDPLNESTLKNIERLEVFDPGDITFTPEAYYLDPFDSRYGKPQFYNIINEYGQPFLVHESRLLLFHGGFLPNRLKMARQGWGATILEQVQERLAHYDESLCLAIQALRKLSQGILKLANLDNMMMNDMGRQQVEERLDLIDLYRSIDNTIALDTDDEYDIKNLSLASVKDIIEQAEYALSAVTNIPATILFGRAPQGMNSTGKSDMENYYNMVRRIQQRTLKPNLGRLIWLLNLASDYDFKLPSEYKIEFNPLWNPSAKEEAETKKLFAEGQKQKAEAAKIYRELGALDGKEIRDTLAESEDYMLDRSLDDELTAPVEE